MVKNEVRVKMTVEQHAALAPLIKKLDEAHESGFPGMILSQPWLVWESEDLIFWFVDADLTEKLLAVTHPRDKQDGVRDGHTD